MICKRLNCGECLTHLTLTNNVRVIHRYLTNMDRSVPLDPLITITFSSFSRFIVKDHNDVMEITQLVDYTNNMFAQQVLLSFATMAAARQYNTIRWSNEVHPFYFPISLCDWITVEIVSMFFMAVLVDRTKNPFEIIPSFRRFENNRRSSI